MTALSRLLIVDDEKDNLETLKRLLRKDFEIASFTEAAEALEFLKTNPDFEVLLSDQRMPGMSGSEFFEEALKIAPLPTRILLTGYADLEAVTEAINRGHIWNYLSKPWEPDDLKRVLAQAAERCQMQRSLESSKKEIEGSLRQLRARDWARGRMLLVLLHEFRTSPQVLEAVLELNKDPEAAPPREKFILSLKERFAGLEKEILELIEEEKRILPSEVFYLEDWLKNFATQNGLDWQDELKDIKISANSMELSRDLLGMLELLRKNTSQASVSLNVEDFSKQEKKVFLIFTIEDSKPPFPDALKDEPLDLEIAWPALLEPFVGSDDFKKHSQGLRFESSKRVRRLASWGIRAEFQIQNTKGKYKVEMLLSVPVL